MAQRVSNHVPLDPQARQRLLSELTREHNRQRMLRPHPRLHAYPRPKRRWWRRFILAFGITVLILGGTLLYHVITFGSAISSSPQPILKQLATLFFRPQKVLAGEHEGRINVLLIAIGGPGHEGENLADTIILASVKPETKDVAFLSIPRDLYVQIPDSEHYSKINNVHAVGEARKKGIGPLFLKKAVENVTGQKVHYYVRVDFIAFKRAVDELGGIDITIPKTFYDFWHRISFPAGKERMNGERALAYVRARYIEPKSEAGDFRRAERTQQVLLAIRKKAFSTAASWNFSALRGVMQTLKEHVKTDMQLWEMQRFYNLVRELRTEKIKTAVLTSGPGGLLVGKTIQINGMPASVLVPADGSFEAIRFFAANIFNAAPSVAGKQEVASPPPQPVPEKPATLEIRNGTNIQGLAARARRAFERMDYTVVAIGNAKRQAYKVALIIDLTRGRKPRQLEEVRAKLGGTATTEMPKGESPSHADFLIILGTDVAPDFPPP
jgi:LCP family protein required for cell wall assembly